MMMLHVHAVHADADCPPPPLPPHPPQQEFYGREVIVADREMVEDGADEFLDAARDDDIALLVVGDPFGATTHTDLTTRCKEKQVCPLSLSVQPCLDSRTLIVLCARPYPLFSRCPSRPSTMRRS